MRRPDKPLAVDRPYSPQVKKELHSSTVALLMFVSFLDCSELEHRNKTTITFVSTWITFLEGPAAQTHSKVLNTKYLFIVLNV